MRISATDIDDGKNSIVHYSLDTTSFDSSYFHIDPDTGVIFLNKTIDVSKKTLLIFYFHNYSFKMTTAVVPFHLLYIGIEIVHNGHDARLN